MATSTQKSTSKSNTPMNDETKKAEFLLKKPDIKKSMSQTVHWSEAKDFSICHSPSLFASFRPVNEMFDEDLIVKGYQQVWRGRQGIQLEIVFDAQYPVEWLAWGVDKLNKPKRELLISQISKLEEIQAKLEFESQTKKMAELKHKMLGAKSPGIDKLYEAIMKSLA